VGRCGAYPGEVAADSLCVVSPVVGGATPAASARMTRAPSW